MRGWGMIRTGRGCVFVDDSLKRIQSEFFDDLSHKTYSGVEFSRDIVEYNELDYKKANMPYVFTAILSESDNEKNGWGLLGDIKSGITQTSQVYIDFQLTIVQDELWIFWDYVSDLFERSMIETMFGQVINMLNKIIEQSEDNLYEDIVLSQISDDSEILKKYNDTGKKIGFDNLTKELYEQAKRTPDSIAIINKKDHLTFRQVNEISNQVAHYLMKKGIKRNDYVGVYASRKIGSVINMIGILKAGAAYVPIDPE